MNRPNPHNFDDATLLAYVEGTMTPNESAAFAKAAGSDARLMASLRLMQFDRQRLAALDEPQAPATLAADVLAQVERSMLLETDLVAPPIDMRKYRATHWQRYAAAAGFVLLLTGGAFMLLNTLRFDSRDEVFAPDSAGRDEVKTPTASEDGVGSLASSPQPLVPSAPTETEREEAASRFEMLVEAMTDRDESALAAAIDRERPTDFDLYANVSASDPAAAYEVIVSRLRSAGGDLIANATINPSPPLPGLDRGVPGIADLDRLPSDRVMPAADPLPDGIFTPPIVPDDRVPLADQSRYAARGFQFTILGTPSDILNVLRELGADRSMRITWTGPGAPGVLVDLAAPNLPTHAAWDRILLWWLDPAARFDEARLAAAQASTEPYVRIPVRIIASEPRR